MRDMMEKKMHVRRAAMGLLAFLFAFGALFALPQTAQAKDYSTIRIKLSNANDGTLNVALNGNYSLKENGVSVSGELLIKNTNNALSVYRKTDNSLLYSGKSVRILRGADQGGQSGTIRMFNQNNGQRNYLGDMSITAEGKLNFSVINILPLEHYLYGVVAYEMNNSWPLETLKAQAVAARSYAAGRISGKGTYDLGDTPKDQVYKGYNSDYQNVKAAVDGTKGEVLTYNDRIILPYYGASNGGQTELTENVWSEAQGYSQMRDDPYDVKNTQSPKQMIFFPTKVSASTPLNAKLEKYLKTLVAPKLKQQGYSTFSDQIEIVGISSLKGAERKYPAPSRNYVRAAATIQVRVMKGDGDGLVMEQLEGQPKKPTFTAVGEAANGPLYTDEKGDLYDAATMQDMLDQYESAMSEWVAGGAGSLESSGEGFTGSGDLVDVDVDFRIYDLKDKAMGYRLFTNDNLIMYTVEKTKEGNNLVNVRFGHGVGMSQRGAQQMGKEGKSYRDIINFYFKDVAFKTLTYSNSAADPGGSTEASASLANGLAEASPTVTAKVKVDTAIYASANGQSGKIATLKKNAKVNVLAQTGNWLLIQTTAGTTGFASVSNVYVEKAEGVVESDATLTDVGGNEIGSISAGSSVNIVGRNGESYSVAGTEEGQTGYLPVSSVSVVVLTPQVNFSAKKNYGQADEDIEMYKEKALRTNIGSIPQGAVFEIVSKTAEGCYNVVYNGKKGVINAEGISSLGKGAKSLDIPAYVDSLLGADAVIDVDVAAGIPNLKYGGFTVIGAAVQAGESVGKVKGTTVNMRASASTAAKIVEQLAAGTSLTIVGQSGDFYRVRAASGKEGYVAKSFVEVSSSARVGVIRSANVNMRASASANARVAGKLNKDQRVTVLGSEGSFFHIETADGRRGYVSDSFLIVQPGEVAPVKSSGGNTSNESKPTGGKSSGGKVIATGTITGGNINLRKTASSSGEVLGVIPKGTKVGIIASNSGYYKVQYNGNVGYVLSTYIPKNTIRAGNSAGGGSGSTKPTASSGTSTGGGSAVATTGANIRAKASRDATKVGIVYKNERVEVLGSEGEWLKISTKGVTGYVLAQYIDR